jgi:hypothetical protein
MDGIGHPALTGEPWPVIGVRVRREGGRLRAASWRPAPLSVPEDVLLPCTWPELEGLAEIATGASRARVYLGGLSEAEAGGWLVLCLRGARARRILTAMQAARRGRSVRAVSAGLPTLGGRF